MARHREPLNGGLVTIRDPSLLDQGQMSVMQNAVSKPGTLGVHRARGRLAFGTVSATAVDVVGLRDAKFDNDTHVLLSHASASYLTAAVGDSGTFGSLVSAVGVGSQLEVVHYRNRFFLFNGTADPTDSQSVTAANTNLVAYLTATGASVLTTRPHGMLAVTAAPTVTTASGTFSQTVTGYYEYWTTELAEFTQDGVTAHVEGTYAGGSVTTVFVSSTAQVPRIQQPMLRNTNATHWRVWRSPKKDREADKKFPSGFAISSPLATATATHDDTLTVSNTGFKFPANFNGAADGATKLIDCGAGATAMGADDGVEATLPVATRTTPKAQGVYGFSFGGFSGSVRGIEVVVDARTSSGTSVLNVMLSRYRRANGDILTVGGLRDTPIGTVSKGILVTSTPTEHTLGGSSDRWVPSDSPTPFADTDFGTSFMVVLGSTTNNAILIDYVKVKVYYGGSIDSVVQFPTVVYTFGDVSAQVGKNGPPPSSSTGAMYDDSLVVNDVSNPGLIRYSAPGDPEAFPATYYVDFETKENDRVRLIKVVNSTLIVALDTSIWRMNFLPSERDASFDRGKAADPISQQYGCVNPMCAATFTQDGGKEQLAFVSHKGIHTTDGYDFNTRTNQIDWRGVISTSVTSTPIALINDAENQKLLFYYRFDVVGGQDTYLCLHLSYAREDLDSEGNFKVTGPVHMRNHDSGNFASLHSAWPVQRSNGDTTVYLGYGGASTAAGAGKVYREGGTTIPALDSTMKIRTRRMYLAGEGSEFRANEVYLHSSSHDATATVTMTPRTVKTDDTAGVVVQGARTKSLSGQKLAKFQFNQIAEGLELDVQATASAASFEYLLVDGEDFGLEDSGK